VCGVPPTLSRGRPAARAGPAARRAAAVPCPGSPAAPFPPSIFLDKNRRDIGKCQSKRATVQTMETARSPPHTPWSGRRAPPPTAARAARQPRPRRHRRSHGPSAPARDPPPTALASPASTGAPPLPLRPQPSSHDRLGPPSWTARGTTPDMHHRMAHVMPWLSIYMPGSDAWHARVGALRPQGRHSQPVRVPRQCQSVV
jgi:hypothetical protein